MYNACFPCQATSCFFERKRGREGENGGGGGGGGWGKIFKILPPPPRAPIPFQNFLVGGGGEMREAGGENQGGLLRSGAPSADGRRHRRRFPFRPDFRRRELHPRFIHAVLPPRRSRKAETWGHGGDYLPRRGSGRSPDCSGMSPSIPFSFQIPKNSLTGDSSSLFWPGRNQRMRLSARNQVHCRLA